MLEDRKILLLHVSYEQLYGGVHIRKLGFGVPPLGLAALSAYIRSKARCQVRLIDMLYHGLTIRDVPGILDNFKPDIVGLSSTTPQMADAYSLSRIVKACNPHVKIVIGGPHVSALPQLTLQEEPSIDYGIVGEGEIPLLSLVEGKPLSAIKSLVWRRDGEIIINPRESLIEDLGSLPFPDYESLPLPRYGTAYTGHSVGITSGRGCTHRCSFCASSITHLGRYRVRPVEVFLDDIQRLLQLHVSRFDIWDDTFTSSKERVYEFIEGYRKRNLKARWTCETRAGCVDKKLLKEMKGAGLDLLHIGCESGNQEILNKIGKGITLEQVSQACGWCKELKVSAYVYFILGLPYDSWQTIRETVAFAKQLPIDFAQFSMLVPLPGTKVWQLAQEGKIVRNLARSWHEYDRYGNAIVESDLLSAQELYRFYRFALRSFYGRLSYILRALKKIDSMEKLKTYTRIVMAYVRSRRL